MSVGLTVISLVSVRIQAGKFDPVVSSGMATVEEFMRTPSEELLERCLREQLVKIAEHFKLDVRDKRLKESMRHIMKENLVEAGVLLSESQAGRSGVETF